MENANEVLNELIELTQKEVITYDSYFCLKYDETDGRYSLWGWSEDLDNIKKNFLSIFICCNIIKYNESNKIDIIDSNLAATLVDSDVDKFEDLNNEEKNFYKLFTKTSKSDSFLKFKLSANKLCKYLTKKGYVLHFELFKNAKDALPRALELDQYLPEEDLGMGYVLYSLLFD